MNMVRGYLAEEIREKLISILKNSDSGMSGVEISKKINVNRITMTKYLKVFAAEGLLRQKNIGNVTLWFLEPGQESFIFPDDYFKITEQYLELLVKGNEDEVYSLIRNCLNSGASVNKLILEVIYPTIQHVHDLYDSGKIGSAEQNLLKTTISKSLNIFNQIPIVSNVKKNVVVIAADPESVLFFVSQRLFGPVFAGIITAAVLSAIMSTADSQLLAVASSVDRDWKGGRGTNIGSARIAILLVVIFAVILSLYAPETIFIRVLFAWTALGAALVPMVFSKVFNWKVSSIAAGFSVLTGFLMTVILHQFPDTPGDILERILPMTLGFLILIYSKRTVGINNQNDE